MKYLLLICLIFSGCSKYETTNTEEFYNLCEQGKVYQHPFRASDAGTVCIAHLIAKGCKYETTK